MCDGLDAFNHCCFTCCVNDWLIMKAWWFWSFLGATCLLKKTLYHQACVIYYFNISFLFLLLFIFFTPYLYLTGDCMTSFSIWPIGSCESLQKTAPNWDIFNFPSHISFMLHSPFLSTTRAVSPAAACVRMTKCDFNILFVCLLHSVWTMTLLYHIFIFSPPDLWVHLDVSWDIHIWKVFSPSISAPLSF